MKSFETLRAHLDERGCLTVSLNRPDVRNAFNEVVIRELTEVFSQEVSRPEVRIVVLRGEGPVFSAGGDLNWMKKSIELDYAGNLKDTRELTQMFARMNECPKPLIGAIHGAAIGGGVGLTSVCDIVVATDDTQFSLSEVRLGIVPACIGPFVIAKIGASQARRLFLSAERFGTVIAREIGLVHEAVADRAALAAAVERLVANMLQCSPNAVGVAKRLVLDLSWPERRAELGAAPSMVAPGVTGARESCYDYVARILAELRVSVEGQEGLKAFLEKRKPSWFL